MLATRLPYRFFVMLMVFSLMLMVPVFLLVGYNMDMMFGEIEDIAKLLPEQRAAYILYAQKMVDDLIVLSFYLFFLCFILSLFFSRRILAPIRELYRGAMKLKENGVGVRMDVTTTDELGEITRAFNSMSGMLVEARQRLRLMDTYQRAVLDPMIVLDEDMVARDVNDAFGALLGYSREEVLGASLFDFLDEESERNLRRYLYDQGEGGTFSHELSVISKGEGLIPVMMGMTQILEDDALAGRICVMRDFRQETILRRALRTERDYSETIMDSMVDQLLVIDKDYRIKKANLAARVAASRDIEGEQCHSVFHGRRQRCFLDGDACPVKASFESRQGGSAIHEHTDSTGRRTYSEIVAFPIKDIDGGVKEVVEIIRDITGRKRFEEEIEARNRELTTINSISRLLSQSLQADEIFNKVLDRVIGLMGMDGGGIFFLDEQGRDLICHYSRGLSEDFVKAIARLRVGVDVPGRVALDGQPMISSDISRDSRAETSILKHTGLKGFACVPIRGKERLIGVFFVFSVKAYDFAPDDERALNSISEMTGIAFENIKLYEKMKGLYEYQRLRRAEERTMLLQLSSALSSTLDMDSVIGSTLGIIKETCMADYLWLLVGDEAGNLSLKHGARQGLAAGNTVYPGGAASIEHMAIKEREPLRVKGMLADNRFTVHAALKGFNTAYCIPMYIGDRSYGAFTLYYTRLRSVSEEEIHFLQTVGSVLVTAIERERLYSDIAYQEQISGAVLEGIEDGVISVDREGQIVSANEAAWRILGSEGGVGTNLADLLTVEVGNTELVLRLDEAVARAFGGVSGKFEASVVAPGGRRVPLTLRSSPVMDHAGTPSWVVFVLRDMSRELELDAMKTDFLRSVSHEFRTPLTAIIGMTEMIMDGEVEGERLRQYLRHIHAEGRRLATMVSDVLDVVRIESGKDIFTEGTIDFVEVVRNINETFDGDFKRKGIAFTSRIEGGIRGVMGDEQKIKQMLRNLMDNAVTYSDRAGEIRLGISPLEDGGVNITVSDSGRGIDEDDLGRVGEKFYRGRGASGIKGTGLGLALCKRIAAMHGGDLTINSRIGMGTTVTVTLKGRSRAR